MDLASAILTDHARQRLAARQIAEQQVREALAAPESITPARIGRVIAQAMIDDTHLLRVFVDTDRDPPEIVTAYRTSKLSKYRSEP